jgi:hypothetical protein
MALLQETQELLYLDKAILVVLPLEIQALVVEAVQVALVLPGQAVEMAVMELLLT